MGRDDVKRMKMNQTAAVMNVWSVKWLKPQNNVKVQLPKDVLPSLEEQRN